MGNGKDPLGILTTTPAPQKKVADPLGILKKKDWVSRTFGTGSQNGGLSGGSGLGKIGMAVEKAPKTPQEKVNSLGINVTFEKEQPKNLLENPGIYYKQPDFLQASKPTYIDVDNPEHLSYLSSKVKEAKDKADPTKYGLFISDEQKEKYRPGEAKEKIAYADELMQEISGAAAKNAFNKIISEKHPSMIGRNDLTQVGIEYLKQVDPAQYKRNKTIIDAGEDLGDENKYNLEKIGGSILKNNLPFITDDAATLNNIEELTQLTDQAHPEIALAKGWDIIGAYNHKKDNKATGGWWRTKPTLGQAKKWIDEPELVEMFKGNEVAYDEIKRKLSEMPDELNNFKLDEVPVGGLMNNFGRAILGSAENVGNIFRGDVKRQQANLNPTLGRGTLTGNYHDPGESPALLQQLYSLEANEKDGTITESEKQQLKALRNSTKVRDGWDKIADGTGNISGQVVSQVLLSKGAGLGTNSVSKLASLSNATKNTINASIATALNSYDQSRQQAVYNFPDDKVKQGIYTGTMVAANVASERIFKDEKVLDAFKKELKGDLVNYVKNLSTQNINRAAIKNLLTEKLLKFGGETIKESNKEAIEESVVQVVDEAMQAGLGAEGYDGDKALERIGNTYATTMLYGGAVGALAAKSNLAADKFNRVQIYRMANNPEVFQKEIQRQFEAGDITNAERQEKFDILNKAAEIAAAEPPKVAALPTKKKAEYLTHQLNIAINDGLLEGAKDSNLQEELKGNIEESQKRAKAIYESEPEVLEEISEPELTPEQTKAAKILGLANLPDTLMAGAEADPVGTLKDIAHQAQGVGVNPETGQIEPLDGGGRTEDLLAMGYPQKVIDQAIEMFPAQPKLADQVRELADENTPNETAGVSGSALKDVEVDIDKLFPRNRQSSPDFRSHQGDRYEISMKPVDINDRSKGYVVNVARSLKDGRYLHSEELSSEFKTRQEAEEYALQFIQKDQQTAPTQYTEAATPAKKQSEGVSGSALKDVEKVYNEKKQAIEDKLNQQLEDNKDRLDDIDEKGGTKTVRQKIYQEHTNEMVELEKWKMKEDLKNEDTPDGRIKKNNEFSANQLTDAIPNSEVHYENKEDYGVTTITLRDKNSKKHIASIDIGTGDTIDGYAGVRIQVNGEHQGKGLSKHLYNLALTEAKKQGLKGLYTIDEMLKTPDKTISTRDNFVTRKNTDEKLKSQARKKYTNIADPSITFIENVSDKFIKKGATELAPIQYTEAATPAKKESGGVSGSALKDVGNEQNDRVVEINPSEISLKDKFSKDEFNNARNRIRSGGKSRTPNEPISVTKNIETGEIKVTNGYHRLFNEDGTLKDKVDATVTLVKTVDRGRYSEDVPMPTQYTEAAGVSGSALKDVESTVKAIEKNPSVINKIIGDEYYHGTSLPKSEPDFTTANKDKGVGVRSNAFMGTSREQKSPFFFITSERDVANDFAQAKKEYHDDKVKPTEKHTSRIIPFKFNEKKSKVLDLTKDDYEFVLQEIGESPIDFFGMGMYEQDQMWEMLDEPKFAEKLKSLGYDAVKFIEPKRGIGIAVLNTDKIVNSTPKGIAEAYHKAKADGTNPELVKAVEELLGKPTEKQKTETTPTVSSEGVSGSALKDVESKIQEASLIKDDVERKKELDKIYNSDEYKNWIKDAEEELKNNKTQVAEGKGSWRKAFNETSDAMRKKDILRAVADVSTDINELNEISKASKGLPEGLQSEIDYAVEHKKKSLAPTQYTEAATPKEQIQENNLNLQDNGKESQNIPTKEDKGTSSSTQPSREESPEKLQKRYERVIGETDLTDPYDRVLEFFANGGKINASSIENVFGGKDKRINWKASTEGEKRSKIGLIAKDGQSIDKLADTLSRRDPKEENDSQVYKNAIEQVLLTHNSKSQMQQALVDKYDLENAYEKYMEQAYGKEAIDIVEKMSEEEINYLLQLDSEKAGEFIDDLVEKKIADEKPTIQEADTAAKQKIAELEAERDAKILKEGRPDVRLEFVSAKELVDSKDPIGNRNIHNDIKERFKKLKEILDCIHG